MIKSVICITHTAKFGFLPGMISGYVCREDGTAVNADYYRVTAFVRFPFGDYIKPTYEQHITKIQKNGGFNICFTTGNIDEMAEEIDVLLIAAKDEPSDLSYESWAGVAVDMVKITRGTDIDIKIEPNRQIARRAVNPIKKGKIALDVNFYTGGLSPDNGDKLSEELIRKQLEAIRPYCDEIRLFGASGELTKAYKIAHDMGFETVGTAWLSGEADDDKVELDALIKLADDGYIKMAVAGSETILRGDYTVENLIKQINYVRENITVDIPVTTADTAFMIRRSEELRNACDVIFVNSYPYWENVPVENALENLNAVIADLNSVSDGKEVAISETGWPTDGSAANISAAVASEENAALYFNEVRKWSLSTNTRVYWFEAADEAWKGNAEGSAGAYWGIMDGEIVIKSDYAETDFFKREQDI